MWQCCNDDSDRDDNNHANDNDDNMYIYITIITRMTTMIMPTMIMPTLLIYSNRKHHNCTNVIACFRVIACFTGRSSPLILDALKGSLAAWTAGRNQMVAIGGRCSIQNDWIDAWMISHPLFTTNIFPTLRGSTYQTAHLSLILSSLCFPPTTLQGSKVVEHSTWWAKLWKHVDTTGVRTNKGSESSLNLIWMTRIHGNNCELRQLCGDGLA